jgi:transcriptional regulator with XRE-family HTH domain
MTVGEKLRYLRTIEGTLRGFDHEMTQQAVSAAIEDELGERISQSYLSQIERGLRPHLTNTTRMTLARFFKVHPGYLVDDPEGFHTELTSDVRALEDNLDLWLISGAERFSRFPDVHDALIKLAVHKDTHRVLVLVAAILDTPGLAERLLQTLRPELAEIPIRRTTGEKS